MIKYEKRYKNIAEVTPSHRELFTDRKFLLPKQLKRDEFIDYVEQFSRETSIQIFSISLKNYWLSNSVRYSNGEKMVNKGRGINVINKVIKDIAGRDTSWLKWLDTRWLQTYFLEFFPRMLRDDIFKNSDKYKFPYENIGLEHLLIVHQMPQRLDLLDMAEKEKMKYSDFLNYVVNFALCHNEAMKRRIFSVKCTSGKTIYYIKNHIINRY